MKVGLISILTGPLVLWSCAVGKIAPDGGAWGIAVGQAEIRSCPTQAPLEGSCCGLIQGGALSPEGSKALGPLSRWISTLTGL